MQPLQKIIEAPHRLLGEFGIECVVIGGVAASLHGSERLTNDIGICYSRQKPNLERLAKALQSVNARLRNAPDGIPFVLDAETLHRGLNFTFETNIGNLDLLGEVRGVGFYNDIVEKALPCNLFGHAFKVMSIEKLIIAKRTAGRPKDLLIIPELEAIQELQNLDRKGED